MSQENVQNVAEVTATQPLKITISSVLGLLEQGKNRKEIAEYYGKTQTEMNKLVWSHPKLKGRKIKKQYVGIELEDDTEDEVVAENTAVEVVEVVEEVAQVPSAEYVHTPSPELANAFPTEEAPATETPSTSDWN
jgi:hypothetical protein